MVEPEIAQLPPEPEPAPPDEEAPLEIDLEYDLSRLRSAIDALNRQFAKPDSSAPAASQFADLLGGKLQQAS